MQSSPQTAPKSTAETAKLGEISTPPVVHSKSDHDSTLISFVDSALSVETHLIKPENAVRVIREGDLRKEIEEIRRVYAETLAKTGSVKEAGKAASPLKKELPGFMWCGVFSARGDRNLQEYSRLLCADLDHLDPVVLTATVAKLRQDAHVCTAFLSPTGTGLKVVFRVAGSAKDHHGNFLAVRDHVKGAYGLEVDEACKNVERLCFGSFDPDAWWRIDTVPLKPLAEVQKGESALRPSPKTESRPHSAHKERKLVGATTLRSLLAAIPSDDRDVWLNVLGALKLWGEENGKEDLAYELADEWARTSSKYDEDDQERTWESLRRDRDSGNVATIGSLFHLARKHGWKSALETTVEELASLDPVEYDRQRINVAADLGIRIGTLDDLVKEERNKKAKSETGLFDIPEPWPEEVNGEDLIDQLVQTLNGFAVLPVVAYPIVALLVVLSYCFALFAYTPILSVRSPDVRCGKSRLLELLAKLVNKPLLSANATAAALFRAIEAWGPTLMLDEWDSQQDELKEAVKNILNSGFHQNGSVLRCEGDENQVRVFHTFCPKVVAGIGELPAAAASRAITITMHRKLASEKVGRLRTFDGTELRRKILRFVTDNRQALENAKPELPEELDDRQQDILEPVFAVADLCGEWGNLARVAALELCKTEATENLAVELLRDIRRAFTMMGEEEDRLKSEDLLSRLNGMGDRPWATSCDGKPLHAHRLSKMLARFGIAPGSIRIGRNTPKGYRFAQFEDAWKRYLPNNQEEAVP
jgi:hypothetical protein